MADCSPGKNSSPVNLPSDRSFGVLFITVFAVSAAYGVSKHWSLLSVALLCLTSLILALITLLTPATLAPLNRAWFLLGQLMGKVVSPVVLGAIFYGLISPIALITRALGRDELKIKPRNAASYWVERDSDPGENSLKNQF